MDTKCSSFLAVSFCFCLSFAHADLDSGLVAHYPFDGSVKDTSGNGQHGTAHGATFARDPNGLQEKAMKIHDPDYVSLPHDVFNGLGDFTVAAWVKLDATMLPGGRWAENNIVSVAQGGAQNELVFGYRASVSAFSLHVKGGFVKRLSDSTPEDLQWHHATLVRDDTEASLYIDGKYAAGPVTVSATPLATQPDGVVIGREQDCVGGCWDPSQNLTGKIDDLRIYNRALSPAEIAWLARQLDTPKLRVDAGVQWDGVSRVDLRLDAYDFSTGQPLAEGTAYYEIFGPDPTGTIEGSWTFSSTNEWSHGVVDDSIRHYPGEYTVTITVVASGTDRWGKDTKEFEVLRGTCDLTVTVLASTTKDALDGAHVLLFDQSSLVVDGEEKWVWDWSDAVVTAGKYEELTDVLGTCIFTNVPAGRRYVAAAWWSPIDNPAVRWSGQCEPFSLPETELVTIELSHQLSDKLAQLADDLKAAHHRVFNGLWPRFGEISGRTKDLVENQHWAEGFSQFFKVSKLLVGFAGHNLSEISKAWAANKVTEAHTIVEITVGGTIEIGAAKAAHDAGVASEYKAANSLEAAALAHQEDLQSQSRWDGLSNVLETMGTDLNARLAPLPATGEYEPVYPDYSVASNLLRPVMTLLDEDEDDWNNNVVPGLAVHPDLDVSYMTHAIFNYRQLLDDDHTRGAVVPLSPNLDLQPAAFEFFQLADQVEDAADDYEAARVGEMFINAVLLSGSVILAPMSGGASLVAYSLAYSGVSSLVSYGAEVAALGAKEQLIKTYWNDAARQYYFDVPIFLSQNYLLGLAFIGGEVEAPRYFSIDADVRGKIWIDRDSVEFRSLGYLEGKKREGRLMGELVFLVHNASNTDGTLRTLGKRNLQGTHVLDISADANGEISLTLDAPVKRSVQRYGRKLRLQGDSSWAVADVYFGPIFIESVKKKITNDDLAEAYDNRQSMGSLAASAVAHYGTKRTVALREGATVQEDVDILSVELSLQSRTATANYSVSPSAYSVAFDLFAPLHTDVSISIQDDQGRAVTVGPMGETAEFPASIVRKDTHFWQVQIPSSAGQVYTISADLVGVSGNYAPWVEVSATETPVREAEMFVNAEGLIFSEAAPGSTGLVVLGVEELGEQQPLQDLLVEITGLANSRTGEILGPQTSASIGPTTLPAAGKLDCLWSFVVPTNAFGAYTGTVSITASGQMTQTFAVAISVPQSSRCRTTFGDGTQRSTVLHFDAAGETSLDFIVDSESAIPFASLRLLPLASPPTALSVDIGADGVIEWQSGAAWPSQTWVFDWSQAVEDYMQAQGDTQDFMTVPIRIISDSAGDVALGDLRVCQVLIGTPVLSITDLIFEADQVRLIFHEMHGCAQRMHVETCHSLLAPGDWSVSTQAVIYALDQGVFAAEVPTTSTTSRAFFRVKGENEQ